MSETPAAADLGEPRRIVRRQAAAAQSGWRRWLPGLDTLSRYEAKWLPHDIVAGLVLTTMLVPVGIAYAVASGLPGIYGLYATIVPLLAYALFGPSRIMVLGPDSSLAAIILGVVLPLSGGDPQRAVALAGAMAIVSGAVCILAGIARLGFVTELLSKPIRYGYMNGIALTVLISQLPKLFGFSDREPRVRCASIWAIVERVARRARRTGRRSPSAPARSRSSCCSSGSKRVPGILIAVVGATVVVGVLDLAAAPASRCSARCRRDCRIRHPLDHRRRHRPGPDRRHRGRARVVRRHQRALARLCRADGHAMSTRTRRWSASARPTSPPASSRAFRSAAARRARRWPRPPARARS